MKDSVTAEWGALIAERAEWRQRAERAEAERDRLRERIAQRAQEWRTMPVCGYEPQTFIGDLEDFLAPEGQP